MAADLLTSVEVAVGVLLGAALAFFALLFLRRRTIGRGRLLTLCGVRYPQRPRWRMGLLGFATDQLEWFPLSGLTVRPKYRWLRVDFELGAPRRPESTTRLEGLEEPVVVPCRQAETDFDLAMPDAAYTALRSWVEAGPPRSAGSVM